MRRSLLPWIALVAVALAAALLLPERAPQSVVLPPEPSIAKQLDVVAHSVDPESGRRPAVTEESSAEERVRAANAHARAAGLDVSYTLAPPAWLSGVLAVRVVRDEDGAPISGARVMLLPVGEEIEIPADDITNDAGSVRFDGLGSGMWIINTTAEHRLVRRDSAYLDEQNPTSEIEVRLVLRREISVRLVDEAGREHPPTEVDRLLGLPVSVVAASECSPVGSTLDHHAILRGASRAPDRKRGDSAWKLVVDGTGARYVSVLFGSTVLGAAHIDPAAVEVDVRIGAAAIRDALAPVVVRVVSEHDGLPVPGALVAFDIRRSQGRVEGRTDEHGRVQFRGPIDGGSEFSVLAPGFAKSKRTLNRPIGSEVLVNLVRGRRVERVLADEYGQPIPGGTVVLHGVDDVAGRLASKAPVRAKSAKDGTFSFTGLDAGVYAVGGRGDVRASSKAVMPDDFVRVDCRNRDALYVIVVRSETPPIPRAGGSR